MRKLQLLSKAPSKGWNNWIRIRVKVQKANGISWSLRKLETEEDHENCLFKCWLILTWKPANRRNIMAGQAEGGAALNNSTPASSRRPNLDKGPSWMARCNRALHKLNSRTFVYRSNSEKTVKVSDSCLIKYICIYIIEVGKRTILTLGFGSSVQLFIQLCSKKYHRCHSSVTQDPKGSWPRWMEWVRFHRNYRECQGWNENAEGFITSNISK